MANRWLADLIGTLKASFSFGAKATRATLGSGLLTAARTFNLPDASSTIAVAAVDNDFSAAQTIRYSDSATTTTSSLLTLRHNSSGTPGAGFGASVETALESTTTEGRPAGRIRWQWATATDASRASRCVLSTYNVATEQDVLTITSGATATAAVAGNLSATGTVTGSNLSGTNTGDQTITLTGHVTGGGTGSFATTIGAGVVTNAMLAGSIDLTAKVTGLLPPGNGGVPPGTLLPYAGASAPTGYLICDGSAVSRTTYAALWDVLRNGTSSSPFGNGDGSTTFNVPDLRRRVPMGVGGTAVSGPANTRGATGGAETHTLTTAEMPAHTHTYNSPVVAGATFASGANVGFNLTAASSSTGGDGAHANVQPSVVVNYIVKT